MKKQLLLFAFLLSAFYLQSQVGPPPPPCVGPSNVLIVGITQTSAIVSWTPTTAGEMIWEVAIVPAGLSPAVGTAIIATEPYFTATGLVCGTTYQVYVRIGDCGGPPIWTQPLLFSTASCVGNGNAENLIQCASSGEACFDLTVNDDNIIGTLNPSLYEISYHLNSADAANDTAAINAPLCIPGGSQLGVYARLEEIATGEHSLSGFTIMAGSVGCPGLRLNAFRDENGNGVQDNGESVFTLGQFHYERNDDGNVETINSWGFYDIYDTEVANSYDIGFTIYPEYASYYALATPDYFDVHVSGTGITTYNFPITVTTPFKDAAIYSVSYGAPRPGFVYTQAIVYKNLGNVSVSGTITFSKDAIFGDLNTMPETTPTATGFTYDFTNLGPFQNRTILVSSTVPVIPNVTLGQVVTSGMSVVVADDALTQNDTFSLSETIIGSYDPNDKMEAHGSEIIFADFDADEYLTYTIRFENTGTAAAENIKITDELDAQLDATSARMVASSHNCTMERIGNNLSWQFTNVQLPPTSESDLLSGHGYVTFKVKTASGVGLGDMIPNTASIYFDFNPAIVTNQFETRFVAVLGVTEFEKDNVSVYPNPASDQFTITVKEGNVAQIAISDISGKTVLKSESSKSQTEIVDISKLSTGMYFVEITTDSNLKTIKKLIIK